MSRVLFVLHSRVRADDPAVVEAQECLGSRGHTVDVFQRQAPPVDQPGRFDGGWELDPARLDGVDLAVTFGGDGTFLHSARTAVLKGVPLLGVNQGRLGFLTWTHLQDAAKALCGWSDGETLIETRATLTVQLGGKQYVAINEAALLKDPAANVIQVVVSVEGKKAGMFHADGVVIATPTGSTAYAASAGGPILDPRVEATVVVPLNPHTLASRALVLPGGDPVEVRVDEATRLLLDGSTNLDVAPDSTIRCALDGPPLRVVRSPGNASFYEQLRAKMRWGEPLVREGRR